jgi:hypothetical protein
MRRSAWQNTGRQRQSQSASRTPQNRSGTASPNHSQPTPPARQDGTRASQPVNNVWTQKGSNSAGNNAGAQEGAAQSQDGPDVEAIKTWMNRNAGVVNTYQPAEAAPTVKPAGAWGSKRTCSTLDVDICRTTLTGAQRI